MPVYAKTALVMTALAVALPATGQVSPTCARCTQVQRQPYMAEFKNTHVQTLADGTTITRETKEVMALDSQGRRLTANSIEMVLPDGPQRDRLTTHVNDPVENTEANWDSLNKTARVIKLPPQDQRHGCWSTDAGNYRMNYGPVRPNQLATELDARLGPGVVMGTGAVVSSSVAATGSTSGIVTSISSAPSATPPAAMPRPAVNRPVQEDLGTDVIEGVEVRGYRTTTTIPVGQIGNDRPIVTTGETWMAPSLGIVLRSVNDSPQSGKQTREITSLSLGDPDPSLFQPPEGYKVTVEELHQVPCESEPGVILAH
jgi:hypothetical protein